MDYLLLSGNLIIFIRSDNQSYVKPGLARIVAFT